MNIIINTPYINFPAGVANHYLGLKPYFSENVRYNQIATGYFVKSKTKNKIFQKVLRQVLFIRDIIKFTFIVANRKNEVIVLNPSLGKSALKRDALYLHIAKIFNRKTAIFIHGWNNEYYEKLLDGSEIFNNIWQKADAFFVLAEEFKDKLKNLNITSPIYLTTTKVNNRLIEGISPKFRKQVTNLLFLARIEKTKGVFTCIDSFAIVKKTHPNLNLTIVGEGNAFHEAKKYTIENNIKNVQFTGALYGENIKNAFCSADIYILPTTHGEGMPTTILEAMAFGLPVITRPVGGVKDFFLEDKMGYLIQSTDPKDYSRKILDLIENPELTNQISKTNFIYAQENFLASQVAKKLENILCEL